MGTWTWKGVILLSVVLINSEPTGRFWSFSDPHVDPEYTINTDPLLRCVNTTIPANNTAGYWGNYICDLPVHSYQLALDSMYSINPNPDFILYNGDSVPHWLQYWSVEFYTEEMVKTGVANVFHMIQDRFPGVPIYPSLGNHDNFLSDQLPPPPDSDAWLSWIAQLWAPILSPDAIKTVSYGGYYTMLIAKSLDKFIPKRATLSLHTLPYCHRIIHFNSIHCDNSNLYAVLNQTDHAGQFVWLNQTLFNAKLAGEHVWITAHITPTDYLNFCTEYYLQMATEYSDIITAHFFGDRHSDEFSNSPMVYQNTLSMNYRIIRSKTDPNKAVGMMYVMSSLVPEINYNPTFREVIYDPQTANLVDYHHYVAILGDGNKKDLTWELEYSAKEAYQLPDMSPASWLTAWKSMQTEGSPLWDNFIKFYQASYPWSCDAACKTDMLNRIGMVPSAKSIWKRASPLIGPTPDVIGGILENMPIQNHWLQGYQNWNLASLSNTLPTEHVSATCDLCLLGMGIIDELLSLKTPDDLILTELTKLCPIQTSYLPRTCVGFIWLYGPFALPVIAKEENPTRICVAMSICPPEIVRT